MATDIQQGVFYGEPISGDPEIKVTRQTGLAIDPTVGIDPTPPPPIIQGDPLTVVERNQGPHVRGHFDGGVFFADHVADTDQILYADSGVVGTGEANQPPGLARIAAPLTPTAIAQPPPPGFGDMPAVEQRAAIKAQAEAMGFVVSDAPGAPPVVDVIASDQGSNDPRDLGAPPTVFTAAQLPQVKKRAIVPVVLPTPKTRRVVAKKVGK